MYSVGVGEKAVDYTNSIPYMNPFSAFTVADMELESVGNGESVIVLTLPAMLTFEAVKTLEYIVFGQEFRADEAYKRLVEEREEHSRKMAELKANRPEVD